MRDPSVASLSELQAVEAVCRCGGFKRAGQDLGVSHSAMSQQVARLEARLGRCLFERRGGRVQPTAAAKSLAEAYLAAADALERAAAFLAGENGSIRVSLPRSLAGSWLAVRFGRMARVLPGLTIEVHADRAPLDLSRFDAAVVLDWRAPLDLKSELLFEERVAPVCSPVFAAEHRLRRPDELTYLPLISHGWSLWAAWFETAGLPAPQAPAHRLFDAELALEAAAEGHGVALGGVLAHHAPLATGRLVAPFQPALATGRQAFLAWSEQSRDPVITAAFLDWMRQEIASLEATSAVSPGYQSHRPLREANEPDCDVFDAEFAGLRRHG